VKEWGVSARMVTYYCVDGRIEGAEKKGNLWLVPNDAKKPHDGRMKTAKADSSDSDGELNE